MCVGARFTSVGAAFAVSLIAHISDTRIESAPTWAVQPHKLTHIPSDGNGGKRKKSSIQESGDGLPEYLDELAKTAGLPAVIHFLQHNDIDFFDGEHGLRGSSAFVVKAYDPYRPDIHPEWLKSPEDRTTLDGAIREFVQRHQKRRLERHAANGNINGLDNFLDIFATTTRLVHLHFLRGVVKQGWLIPLLLRNVDIATVGYKTKVTVGYKTTQESSYGYLDSLADNLKADRELLRTRCRSRNVEGHVRAALFIAQMVRFNPTEKYGPKSPIECHADHSAKLKRALEKATLEWPSVDDTMAALRVLNVLAEPELAEWQEVLFDEDVD